uniref:hyaluronidase-1-like n=1 Tax=Styela clava TaxID=7725 RepID=UPI00193A392A|nr:hyaluronidase-1-like [Styela clava]
MHSVLGLLSIFACSLIHCNRIAIKQNILSPPLTNKPFVVTWNVASEQCEEIYGVPLDLSDFDIVHNPDKSWRGTTLTIFYADQLGLFPYYDSEGNAVNGGLPQLADLYAHLKKAAEDIVSSIPEHDFQGLAVIDWEAWRPLWVLEGWGAGLIYQNKSVEKVQKDHPDWTRDKILAQAKLEYESGTKSIMEFTLALGKLLRPKALWGFYLYPDCANYNKNGTKDSFKCTDQVLKRNDQIQWVFDDSNALYPSVYLGEWFSNHTSAIYYVAYRILEAMRVDSDRPSDFSIPVFAYHLLTYRKVPEFVSLFDLRDSIGVASLLGSSGMVIWADHNVANSVERCQNLSNYISTTLGPYVKATSDAATLCSYDYCSGHGRCVLSHFPDANSLKSSYLTVAEATDEILRIKEFGGKVIDLLRVGSASSKYSTICQCYNGWTGKSCQNLKL